MVTNQINRTAVVLIQCSVCSSKISSHAASCPSCGHPMALKRGASQSGRKGRKYEAWGTVMVVVGLLAGLTFGVIGSPILFVTFTSIFWVGLFVFIIGRFK